MDLGLRGLRLLECCWLISTFRDPVFFLARTGCEQALVLEILMNVQPILFQVLLRLRPSSTTITAPPRPPRRRHCRRPTTRTTSRSATCTSTRTTTCTTRWKSDASTLWDSWIHAGAPHVFQTFFPQEHYIHSQKLQEPKPDPTRGL